MLKTHAVKADELTVERPQPSRNCQPHLAGDVVGGPRLADADESQHPRVQVAEEHFDGALVTSSGLDDEGAERAIVQWLAVAKHARSVSARPSPG